MTEMGRIYLIGQRLFCMPRSLLGTSQSSTVGITSGGRFEALLSSTNAGTLSVPSRCAALAQNSDQLDSRRSRHLGRF